MSSGSIVTRSATVSLPPALVQPVRLAQARTVDRVADAARVREARLAEPEREVLAEGDRRLVAELVRLHVEHHERDLHQLVDRVVGEVDVVGDARAQARVRREELVHPIVVTGEDDDEPVPLALHHLEQDLDRLLPVVALVLGPVQVVRLVDEEDAAERALQHLLRLRRGMADVLADEVVARAGDDGRALDVAETVQELGDAHRNGGLAGARVAGERHVQRRPVGGEADFLPEPVDDEQRGDLLDPLLDRLEGDELAVEPGEHLVDVRLVEDRLDVDGQGRIGRDRRGERLAHGSVGALVPFWP